MTLESASKILHDPEASFLEVVEAATVICAMEQPAPKDLIRCLMIDGLPRELAMVKVNQQNEAVGDLPSHARTQAVQTSTASHDAIS